MAIPCKNLLIIMAAVLFSLSLPAQTEVSKKISKTYDMTSAGELYLDNKYGDVTIQGWKKNSISILVEITVTHKKKENAEDLLSRISPNIKVINNFISVSSDIAEKSTGFFAKYFNKANPFDFDRSNVQINYTVNLPAKAELEIINKFGDVIVEDYSGKLKLDAQHGDVWINENLNNADVNLRYGKLRAESINYGSIRLKNGSLNLEKSKDLRLNSSGSNIDIETVTALEIYSSKDEITIDEVESIQGSLEFTNMQLNNVDDQINLGMKIADFKVLEVHSADASIVIHQESSEISLNVDGFSFNFDATLEEGLVRLPKSFENVHTKMLDKGKRIREITAKYGNDTQGKISITGEKGVILLKEF
ncbi:hypothetical protein [uncultured Kriegella sp.]|uniref:hypothetical protein n=1 Tax=uncultured Kriegella sp. TaxID=1798910 RepID=UPI0030D6E34A